MRKGIVAMVFSLMASACAQTVPTIGTEGELEVATWNIEWFGDNTAGPSNETRQFSNIKDVIERSEIDVWGFQEISNQTTWNNLVSCLTDYDGVLSTWSQTQKTGLLYNNKKFRFIYQKHILQVYQYEFASGRLPLEVALEFKHDNLTDTLYFFVLHMKANTGSNSDKALALNRRKTAASGLKSYLDAGFKQKYFFVIGDWNDDVDKSIYNNQTSPYQNFVGDTSNYFFASKILTDAGKNSTVYYSNMIDHICASKNTKLGFESNTKVDVFRLDSYISSYGSSTSDHYPVYCKFNPSKWQNEPNLSLTQTEKQPEVFWNGEKLVIPVAHDHLKIFDLAGREFSEENAPKGQVLVYTFQSGLKQISGTFLVQNQ